MKIIIQFLSVSLFFTILITFSHSTVYAGNPPDTGYSSFNVSSSGSNQVSADGHSTINITIILKDNSGKALSGDTVSLSAENDSSASFSPGSTTLNESGSASFTVTSTHAGTDNINVTDKTTNTTLSNFGQVTFVTPTQTPTPQLSPTPVQTCNATAPGSTPELKSAEPADTNKITLTWSAVSPVSYYLISYGLTSGKYIYGNPNVGNVTSYTVGGLAKNAKYYFVVKAVNGCAPGNFSNELSASTGTTRASSPTATTAPETATSETQSSNEENLTPTELPSETPTPSVPSVNVSSYINKNNIIIGGTIIGLILLVISFILMKKSNSGKRII